MIKAASEIRIGDVMIIGGKRWDVMNIAPLSTNHNVLTFRVADSRHDGIYLAFPVDSQVNTYAGPIYDLAVSIETFNSIKAERRKALPFSNDKIGAGEEIRIKLASDLSIYVDVKVTDAYKGICSF